MHAAQKESRLKRNNRDRRADVDAATFRRRKVNLVVRDRVVVFLVQLLRKLLKDEFISRSANYGIARRLMTPDVQFCARLRKYAKQERHAKASTERSCIQSNDVCVCLPLSLSHEKKKN